MSGISEAEVELIAQRAAAQAVRAVLSEYGIDVSSPKESQADMDHLRRWRRAVNSASSTGFVVTLTILISGICGALWLGFQAMIGR